MVRNLFRSYSFRCFFTWDLRLLLLETITPTWLWVPVRGWPSEQMLQWMNSWSAIFRFDMVLQFSSYLVFLPWANFLLWPPSAITLSHRCEACGGLLCCNCRCLPVDSRNEKRIPGIAMGIIPIITKLCVNIPTKASIFYHFLRFGMFPRATEFDMQPFSSHR